MSCTCVLAVLVVVAAVKPGGTLASAFIPGKSSSSDSHFSLHVQVMQEMLAGPLAAHDIVLYLDTALGARTLKQIRNMPALKYSALVLVDLGADGEEWCQKQSMVVLKAQYLVHVVVFISDPRPFFRSVVNANTHWKPKYFLMYSFSNELNSKILMAEEFSRSEKIVLFMQQSIRKINYTGQMEMFTYFPFSHRDQIVSLGLWSLYAQLSFKDILVDRFPTFEGYKFLLATYLFDFPYLNQTKNKPEGEAEGVQVEVLNALATKLNYTFEFSYIPPDGMWGSFENGSWNGMLKMIYSGEKNFTVNYFGYTHKRIEDFDASVSYWMEGFGLALLKPQPLPKWRSVYYSFKPMVWALTAFSIFVVTMAFYLQVSIWFNSKFIIIFKIIVVYK